MFNTFQLNKYFKFENQFQIISIREFKLKIYEFQIKKNINVRKFKSSCNYLNYYKMSVIRVEINVILKNQSF